MNSNEKNLSDARIQRLKNQGYLKQTDKQIAEMAFGNRLAFIISGIILATGLITTSLPLLTIMLAIALFSLIFPYHPVDYLYNHLLCKLLNKPKLPPRSIQFKFTSLLASVWLTGTIVLFYLGFNWAGYIAGALLLVVVFIVSTTDFCIPSAIYNFIFKVKTKSTEI